MASQPQQSLPLFYNDLTPLSSALHADWRFRPAEKVPFLAQVHAVPLLAEEFIQAQRHYPIVFSAGENPVPLALMGLNEGVNVFFDEDGMLREPATYVPAYVRRYPFMLARLRPDTEELSLCFDPSAEALGAFAEGDALFDGSAPSEFTKGVLGFCEQFEQASQLTGAFVRDLIENKLLIDGEFSAQPNGAPEPYVYRGFQIVSEEALRNLRGDLARKLIQSGALPLIYAHVFSLQKLAELFGRQSEQGKLPAPTF
ncbi:SapC family protein [Sphingomonas morindae]|uniref:SapC family protein n=1 Tax=Sphingomonas morindae TaxID=1541170 RepID=A0ABY4X7N0_9SPHN|nr:SapC family protein [Sphingomonas morindae]USI72917.1 SapC family protein [Sphingomonas morindae]